MRIRLFGMAGVVITAVAVVAGGAGQANADSTIQLQYICTLPGFPSQPMTARLTWNAPSSVLVGRAAPATVINATATVNGLTTAGLRLIGAATVEGSVTAPGVVVAPEGTIDSAVQLTVPRTTVQPGSMTLPASGTTPGLVFHQPGHATIVVGNSLTLHFTPRDANGNPTRLGSADLSCALDSGQKTTVFSFDITPAPGTKPSPPITRPVGVPGHPAGGALPEKGNGTGTETRAGIVPGSVGPGGTTAAATTSHRAAGLPGAAGVRGAADAASISGPARMGLWWPIVPGVLALAVCAVGLAWWLRHRRQSARHGRVPGR